MKKGVSQATQVVVIAILTLVLVGLFVYFQLRLGDKLESRSWKVQCSSSVAVNAGSHFRGLDFSEAIVCPTLDVTVDENLRSIVSKDKAKKQLANLMLDCWDAFGRGKLELFSDDGQFCAVCHVIDFEKKDVNLGSMSKYLLTHRVPRSRVLYMDAFTGSETPQFDEYVESPDFDSKAFVDNVSSSEKYATVVLYVKGEEFIKNVADTVGVSTMTGAAVVGGLVGGSIAYGMIQVGGAIALVPVPGARVAAAIVVVSGVAVGGFAALYDFIRDKPDIWLSTINLVKFNPVELEKLGCKDLPVESGLR